MTFYFMPDLGAGSFRNSTLAIELAKQAKKKNIVVDLYTTQPNRYISFDINAPQFEEFENLRVFRIALPTHKSGMIDQALSFCKFYSEVFRLNRGKNVDLVFASSSRLFTAYLGYRLALKSKATLFLDIRDIFVDTINDVIKSRFLKIFLLPILSQIESRTFKYARHINLISEGFSEYFNRFPLPKYSFYPNGIDDEFLVSKTDLAVDKPSQSRKVIVYAGNIGEGQGLHKIIPQAAKILSYGFDFLIIGDGGARKDLEIELRKTQVENVTIQNPVNRRELQEIYNKADYLFLHLNDYPAFKKVLPSKIFELATFNKPILAGVAGYSAKFIKSEIPNSFVFTPCNVHELVDFLKNDSPSKEIDRSGFLIKYQRAEINKSLSKSILQYL